MMQGEQVHCLLAGRTASLLIAGSLHKGVRIFTVNPRP